MTYEVQGYYSPQTGWECVTAEDSYAEALERLREYLDNEPYAFRIKKVTDD